MLNEFMPTIFAYLLGLAIFLYMVLDGYNVGVGLTSLFIRKTNVNQELINTTAPFWDANETWLVLAVGLLLIAFPQAQGLVLAPLILPCSILLLGIILRGVAYEVRFKAQSQHIYIWHKLFGVACILIVLGQSFIFGIYLNFLNSDFEGLKVSLLIFTMLMTMHLLLGVHWIQLKWRNVLTLCFSKLKRFSLTLLAAASCIGVIAGIIQQSPFLIIPSLLSCIGLLISWKSNQIVIEHLGALLWIICLHYIGLAWHYPFIVPGYMTFTQASAAPSSLLIILYGAMVMLPIIIAYSIWTHFIFKDKITKLHY